MASIIPTNVAGPPTQRSNRSTSGQNFTFPQNVGPYRMQIQMVEYDMSYATGTAATNSTIIPRGGVTLPMPTRINDTTATNWQEESMLNLMASLAQQLPTGTGALLGGIAGGAFGPEGAALGGFLGETALNVAQSAGQGGSIDLTSSIVGAATGRIINPFMWMLFKGPQFKEHQFDWILTANSPEESQTIKDIVMYLKGNMLPSAPAGSAVMDYPLIALMRFYPDDIFGMFKFKPCALTRVTVNYAGGGVPSFFEDNAPTIVNLSISLKEIEIWTYENFGPRAGDF